MSAKRLVEALGGGRRAWVCRCPCPHRPLTGDPNLVVVNTPGGVRIKCMTEGCDQAELTSDLLDRGLTPLDDSNRRQP